MIGRFAVGVSMFFSGAILSYHEITIEIRGASFAHVCLREKAWLLPRRASAFTYGEPPGVGLTRKHRDHWAKSSRGAGHALEMLSVRQVRNLPKCD